MEENLAENLLQEAVETQDGELAAKGADDAVSSPAEESVPPDQEDGRARTRAFSKRLGEMTRKKVDEWIASFGWINQFTGEAITNEEQLSRYREMEGLCSPSSIPEQLAQLSKLQQRLHSYEIDEEDRRLQNDPVLGEAYRQIRTEVLERMQAPAAQGEPPRKFSEALGQVLLERFDQVAGHLAGQAQEQAMRTLTANLKASPGALGEACDNPPLSFERMSDREFERYERMALRGELRKS